MRIKNEEKERKNVFEQLYNEKWVLKATIVMKTFNYWHGTTWIFRAMINIYFIS